jgi:hypothetical protein
MDPGTPLLIWNQWKDRLKGDAFSNGKDSVVRCAKFDEAFARWVHDPKGITSLDFTRRGLLAARSSLVREVSPILPLDDAV